MDTPFVTNRMVIPLGELKVQTLDWIIGLDYWTDVFLVLIAFFTFQGTGLCLLLSFPSVIPTWYILHPIADYFL